MSRRSLSVGTLESDAEHTSEPADFTVTVTRTVLVTFVGYCPSAHVTVVPVAAHPGPRSTFDDAYETCDGSTTVRVAVSAAGPLFVIPNEYVYASPTFVGFGEAESVTARFGAGPVGFAGVTGAEAADAGRSRPRSWR